MEESVREKNISASIQLYNKARLVMSPDLCEVKVSNSNFHYRIIFNNFD